MNSMNKIKEQISKVIHREMLRTEKEIEKLHETQRSNMSSYGIGGPYRRYEKAIARRQEHLSEQEALNKAQGNTIILETLRMYGYYCPSCQEKIYLTSRSPETVECPLCMRCIYIDVVYTEWKVQKNSRYKRLHH